MGIINQSLGTRIYLDANIIIYAVEGLDKYASVLIPLLEAMDSGAVTAITSGLTRAEVLVKPKQDQNSEHEEAYKMFLSSSAALEVVPISDNILEIAAELRATTRLKLPDAIHVATAIVSNCTSFLTNDRSIISPPPYKVVLLSELG